MNSRKRLALHWQIIIGLLLGIAWALASSAFGFSSFTLKWIAPWGTIFIRLLKLIAVPLVLFSIIKGVSGLSDANSLGRLGIKTLGTYLGTTVFAVILGLLLVNTIGPGRLVNDEIRMVNRLSYELWAKQSGLETVDGKNYLENAADNSLTEAKAKFFVESSNEYVKTKMSDAQGTQDSKPLQFLVDMVPENIFLSLGNNKLMLQIIFFALFFGIALLKVPQQFSNPVMHFVSGANEVFLKMVNMIMDAAPFFVFALLAGKLSEMAGNDIGQVYEIFKGLGWYSIVVFIGLVLMAFAFYPSLVKLITKRKEGFLSGIKEAQLLAFTSSSSAATLPVTLECVNENLKVSRKISSFVLPIGATVNMDGTSLYQAVAVIFLAQFHMIELSLSAQLLIILTATLASIGSAAVPSAGLIMLLVVLSSVGLNPAWIAIILPVDRILDMCRTVVNVTGDAAVATIIDSSERGN